MIPATAALFDLDGVIIDTEPQYTDFWAGVGDHFGDLGSDFALKVKGQTLNYIFETYFPSPDERKELARMLDEFENQMRYPLVPGALEFAAELWAAGIPTAVVTSSNAAKMSHAYSARPILPKAFTRILKAEDTPRSKPAPDCYLIAAERLGADISRCVVFEDSFNGLRAGRAAGAHVVGLSTSNPAEAIAPLADVVIPDFTKFGLEQFEALVGSADEGKEPQKESTLF